MIPLPLAGIRVFEAGGGLPAAYCGRQFAAWGAEVVVADAQIVEVAAHGPTWQGPEGPVSLAAAYLGQDKRVTTEAASAGVDVILAGGDPLGDSTLADLRRASPDAVVVSISPFGRSGPRAGEAASFAELEALAGFLGMSGPRDGPPTPSPANLMAYAVGANAFVGALGALIGRVRWGRGDLVEISGLETVAGFVPFLRDQQFGVSTGRCGGTPEGARLLRCVDGYIAVAPAIAAHLEAYREVLGVPDDVVIELGADRVLGAGVDEVAQALAPYAATVTMEEAFLGLQLRGVVCGKVQSLQDVLEDRQLEDLGLFQPTPLSGGISAMAPAVGVRLDGVRPRADGCPSDRGEDRAPTPAIRSERPRAPLDGLRVLDLTQAWIGPICGVMLADLGADVLKIESPARPDIWRFLGQADPDGPRPFDTSCYFNSTNRNKRGVALNLAEPGDAGAFLHLVRSADILIENFTPRVLARLDLDASRLRAENPQLVMTSFSGFGADGPHAEFKANGSSIEALGGWDGLILDHEGRPTLMGGYPADPMCGLHMAAATLLGVYRRLTTGVGAHLEGSMLETACSYIGDALMGESLRRQGGDVSPCVAEALIEADGPDDSWSVVEGARRTPVRGTLQALEDPHLQARAWFITLETDGQGVARHPGRFWRFAEAPLPAPVRPPRHGEHTADVLAELGASCR